MPDTIQDEDVREIIRLLGQIAVEHGDVRVKRRLLIDGIGALIKADYWYWIQIKYDQQGDFPMAFSFVDGGFLTEAERFKLIEGGTSPEIAELNACLKPGTDRHITRQRVDVMDDQQWFSCGYQRQFYGPAGLGDFLSTIYPLGNRFFSSLWFMRRKERPAFTPREICILHLLAQEVDWLHREGTDAPAAERANELSPRQRAVLVRVVVGQSVKQIATSLSLSPHTVNDHLKQIYKRMAVSGRAELMATFFGGGVMRTPVV